MALPDQKDLEQRMTGAIENLRRELAGLRTGRASASLLEPVMVEAYGSQVNLQSVAGVSVPEPRMLTVQVWDQNLTKAVEKAIRESGLGLNPQMESSVIRVPIPPLTEERRRDLSKIAAKYAEQARISVRNIRRDGMDAVKKSEKDGDISQDEHKRIAEDVQKLTDRHIEQIDDILAVKEQEIMQV